MTENNMKTHHTGTQEIDLERICLRKFEITDIPDMLKNWISDDEIQRNYGEPVYTTEGQVETVLQKWVVLYQEQNYYRWAIILKENRENIGQIAFCAYDRRHNCAEIEYCIGARYHNRGYATEALRGVMRFTFEQTGIHRIQAFHRGKNPASGKVLHKAGFHYEGIFKDAFYSPEKDIYDDKVFYGITRTAYRNTRGDG